MKKVEAEAEVLDKYVKDGLFRRKYYATFRIWGQVREERIGVQNYHNLKVGETVWIYLIEDGDGSYYISRV